MRNLITVIGGIFSFGFVPIRLSAQVPMERAHIQKMQRDLGIGYMLMKAFLIKIKETRLMV